MYFLSIQTLVLSALAVQSGLSNAASSEKKPPVACTAHSPSSGSFYDLRPIWLLPPDSDKKGVRTSRTESWKPKRHDYPSNFTLNICGGVIDPLEKVVGIENPHLQDVSAYYEQGGKTYSIGQNSSELIFRGRNLVLQYKNGSPCGSPSSKALNARREVEDDDDDDDDDQGPTNDEDGDKNKEKEKETEKGKNNEKEKESDGHRRKSTLIYFVCDKEPMASGVSISYLGSDPDECAYTFIARSQAACGGAEPVQSGLGPGGVFGVILLIAVVVYFVGGIMYQRTVAHARGWRQLPNYSLWAGIGSFIQDMLIILTSSCARFLPSRRGYISVSANGNGPRGRSGRPEDENRLIDQLDEEWDD